MKFISWCWNEKRFPIGKYSDCQRNRSSHLALYFLRLAAFTTFLRGTTEDVNKSFEDNCRINITISSDKWVYDQKLKIGFKPRAKHFLNPFLTSQSAVRLTTKIHHSPLVLKSLCNIILQITPSYSPYSSIYWCNITVHVPISVCACVDTWKSSNVAIGE